MDYKSFLKPSAECRRLDSVVLPYFGGTRIDAADRRFRIDAPIATLPLALTTIAPGWWRFQIDGRRAVPVEPASPIDLAALPALRGHYCHGFVIKDGRVLARIALPPDDEPPTLARVTARRWYSGDWLFDSVDFEDEAELTARVALEELRPLGATRNVVPSLRAAFGYALGMAIARELEIPMSLHELAPIVVEVADGGREVVRALFDDLVEQRRRELEVARLRAEAVAAAGRLAGAVASATVRTRARDPRKRADDALDGARARMLNCRLIERNTRLDVTYEVDGTRIMSIVDADTLQVIDPGVCLANAHRVLTLDAMPSVVREAITARHLNITRRS